jgi:tRNA threonylcarbamoyladenosine biosynthesis protein TsaE
VTTSAAPPTGQWISRSPEETQSLGARFGSSLRGGEIILLSGQLGAGKTLFVKGVAQSLDVPEDEVTSPSFTLVNHYTGRLKLYHIDLYRLNEGAQAAYAVDLDELLMDESAVIVIEWAERMGAYPLPEPIWRIEITGDGDEPRTISINNQSSPA